MSFKDTGLIFLSLKAFRRVRRHELKISSTNLVVQVSSSQLEWLVDHLTCTHSISVICFSRVLVEWFCSVISMWWFLYMILSWITWMYSWALALHVDLPVFVALVSVPEVKEVASDNITATNPLLSSLCGQYSGSVDLLPFAYIRRVECFSFLM